MMRGADLPKKEKEKLRRIKNPLKVRSYILIGASALVINFFVLFKANIECYIIYSSVLIVYMCLLIGLKFLIFLPTVFFVFFDIGIYAYLLYSCIFIMLVSNSEFEVTTNKQLLVLASIIAGVSACIGVLRYFLKSKNNSFLMIKKNFVPIDYMDERYSRKVNTYKRYDEAYKILTYFIGFVVILVNILSGKNYKFYLLVYTWLGFIGPLTYGMFLYFRKIYDCYQYTKSTGKKLYTEIYPFLERQKEINKKRRENGMRPIEIRSPFYR